MRIRWPQLAWAIVIVLCAITLVHIVFTLNVEPFFPSLR